jgi:hypothetical protein
VNDLVPSDHPSDFVAELAKQLHVAVHCDVQPQANDLDSGRKSLLAGGSSMSGTGLRQKDTERPVSKNDLRTSLARMTMWSVASLR